MPTALAMAAAVQCVVSPGGSALVSATTRSIDRLGQRRDARRPGLVAQQPVDAGLHEALLPAPDRGLALAGLPHDLRRAEAIGGQQHDPARQTCFCGLLRSATTASRRRGRRRSL